MPKYDYRCPDCATSFEIDRSMADREPVLCTTCGTVAKRVFSPVGVAFKGSGFHNTDYRPAPPTEAPSCASKGDSPACASCPAAE